MPSLLQDNQSSAWCSKLSRQESSRTSSKNFLLEVQILRKEKERALSKIQTC